MDLIYKEIILEKLRTKPNREYIRQLQHFVDHNQEINFNQFQTFRKRKKFDDFKREYEMDINLFKDDCVEVIHYLGQIYIQVLSNGLYCITKAHVPNLEDDEYQSPKLEDIEKIYWIEQIMKSKSIDYGQN